MDSSARKYYLEYGGLSPVSLVIPWIIILIWGVVIFFNQESYIFPVILTFSLPVPVIALAVFCLLIWANFRWFVQVETDKIILQELIERHEITLNDIIKVIIVDSSYYLNSYSINPLKFKGMIGNQIIKNYKTKDNEQLIGEVTQLFDKYSVGKIKLSHGKFFLIETASRTFAISPKENELFLNELKEKYLSNQNKSLLTKEIILRY